jgi:DNA-directed RNA polymerase alpha subunit
MSEIQDLKNYVLAIQDKINNLTMMLQNHSKKDDNLNEILNLIHNQNFEKARFNQSLFENVFPDLLRRITSLEDLLLKNRRADIDKKILLDKKIVLLDFPSRLKRALITNGIDNIKKLTECSKYDILKMINVSQKSLDKIVSFLSENNLELSIKG